MTDEQIIEMAKQAHVGSKTWVDIYSDQITVGEVRDFLKAFAKLVAQHERERIFGELLKMHEIASSQHNYYLHAVLTIRARGEA